MSTSDFSDLLRLFEDSGIRYLVVGGHAVMAYASPGSRRISTYGSIRPWRTRRRSSQRWPVLARRWAVAWRMISRFPRWFSSIHVAPMRIDILTSILAVEFADAWGERERRPFSRGRSMVHQPRRSASEQEAVGNRGDLMDVEELRNRRSFLLAGGEFPGFADVARLGSNLARNIGLGGAWRNPGAPNCRTAGQQLSPQARACTHRAFRRQVNGSRTESARTRFWW